MTALSFKRRFVPAIRVGLGISLPETGEVEPPRPKRQTIRAGVLDGRGRMRSGRTNRVRCKVGDMLHLFTGMRTKNCVRIGYGRCVALKPVTIWPDTGAVMLAGKILGWRQLAQFARCDGFDTAADMQRFWLEEHGAGKFSGVVIEWEPLEGTSC